MKYQNILFKNLVIYRFTQPFDLSATELEEKLKAKTARNCDSQEFSTYGFSPALANGTSALVHEYGNCLLIRATKEEKILPSSVIRDRLEERLEEIETLESRQVYSKERRSLKDDIIMELLHKAFTRQKETLAYIDKDKGWLLVDASSFKPAEEITSALRECLGSLPIVLPDTKNLPCHVLTEWLSYQTPANGFAISYNCTLREPGDDAATITARNEELTGSIAIGEHLAAGKMVSKLSVDWQEAFSCQLQEDFRVSQIRYHGIFQDEQDSREADTAEEQAFHDYQVMTYFFRCFLEDWTHAFGGLESHQGEPA
ncbi:recombination-associated protein RdgC [Endozoicomonas sp. 2B-B]